MSQRAEKHNRMQRIKFGMHLCKRVSFKSVWTQIQDSRCREESGMKLDREQHGIEMGDSMYIYVCVWEMGELSRR